MYDKLYPVLIPEYIKEVAHILMGIDIAKEVEKEQSWRVITGRTVRGIAVCD